MQTKSHKDLIAWQKAMVLAEEIYRLTEHFPQREVYGIASQMRRAAISIPSNIAEGRNRGTRKDYAHFLSIAYGSAAELETQLLLAERLVLSKNSLSSALALAIEVSKMLHVMIERLNGATPRS